MHANFDKNPSFEVSRGNFFWTFQKLLTEFGTKGTIGLELGISGNPLNLFQSFFSRDSRE